MMSLGPMRKGKGWMSIEAERRRKVARMMAVYTTGLTTPLNSVLMIDVSVLYHYQIKLIFSEGKILARPLAVTTEQ